MFFIEPGSALSLGVAAYDNRKSLAPLLRRIRYRLKHGHLRVIIYGPAGVGKSTLGTFLAGDLHPGSSTMNYQTSLGVEKYRVKGDIVCTVIAAPGQEGFREDQWPDLHRMLASGKAGAVINVLSGGYESIGELSYKETSLFRKDANQSQEQFLAAHIAEQREKELAVITDLAHHIKTAEQKIWMLTLVTKQDLWWDRRGEVRGYYEQGQYNTHITDIARARGSQNFRHDYVSASLVISNFRTGNGEILAQTIGGYDEIIQAQNQANLLRTITTFAHR
jgi:energy-coupling factor transporter ATP-binding protein EcfA2